MVTIDMLTTSVDQADSGLQSEKEQVNDVEMTLEKQRLQANATMPLLQPWPWTEGTMLIGACRSQKQHADA